MAARFGQLQQLTGWPASVAAPRPAASPDEARDRLTELVDATTLRHLTHGHASPVLLVHTATAPNAVLHTLPARLHEFWVPSMSAIWRVPAAIFSAYAPAKGAPRAELTAVSAGQDAVAEMIDPAVAHADEHVIKFTDTAAEVYTRTGHPDALAAAVQIRTLIGH